MKVIPSILSALVLAIAPTVTLQAQDTLEPVGKWTVYPVFSSPITNLLETTEHVYGLAGGNLFSYNFNTDERRSLNIDNLLNDFDVAEIYYNNTEKYLAAVYENSNIDLLYDDGRVINLPDIKIAEGISGSRKINDVAFSDGRMYVATDFGVVIYDDNKNEVIRSGNFGEKVSSVCESGGKIFILKDDKVYCIDKDSQINKLERFTLTEGISGSKFSAILPYKDRSILVYGDGKLALYSFNADNNTFTRLKSYDGGGEKFATPVMLSDGSFNVASDKHLWTIGGEEGDMSSLVAIPEPIQGNRYSFNRGIDNLWALDKNGLGLYSLAASGELSVKKDKYLPETMSVKCVANITPSEDGERLYFSNLGPSVYRLSSAGEGENTPQQTCRMVDGKFYDIAPYPIEAKSYMGQYWQGKKYKWLMSPTRLVEDPDDPDTYFIGTNTDGLYRITNGEESGRFDYNNSPLTPIWSKSSRVFEVGIDRGGNLWMVSQRFTKDADIPLVMVLPASKRNADTSTIKPEDWIIIPVDNNERGIREPRILFCKKSNMIFVGMTGLLAIDTRGTFNDLSDDIVVHHDGFTDQDGKSFSYANILSLEEDLDGRIWVGTDAGVFEITNPSSATNPSMIINHLKVPLNDGTNTAEYLLPSERIYGISTDNANRKWIATRSSGLFLVSQRGDKILQNFTSENSVLPDNMVHDVYSDPRDNRVWIGTSQGLVSYSSDASPVRDDFSDIYAYPNPVRPDYTGLISIVGLMDNTLVKITDAAGMLISQVKAEGGMARWDGCNLRGERVRSGVYYVFASSSDGESSSSGAVTKILVVN